MFPVKLFGVVTVYYETVPRKDTVPCCNSDMMDPDWTVYLIDVWLINRCALLIVAAIVDRRQYQEISENWMIKRCPQSKKP